jgi:predicted component of type VI protein secretion system
MARADLHLVITVFDVRFLTAVEEVSTRFPVRVGRGSGNDVRLTAGTVSRDHGIFSLEPGSMLQYMDLGSTHGTYVDGIKIEPMELVSLRDSSTIEIGPYQLTFHLRHGPPRTDRRPTAPTALTVGPPSVSLWKDTLAASEAMRRLRVEHTPTELLRHAAEVIELMAEVIVLFRRPPHDGATVLRSSRAPDQIVAHLLSPSGRHRSLRELRDVLTDLFMASAHTGAPS